MGMMNLQDTVLILKNMNERMKGNNVYLTSYELDAISTATQTLHEIAVNDIKAEIDEKYRDVVE